MVVYIDMVVPCSTLTPDNMAIFVAHPHSHPPCMNKLALRSSSEETSGDVAFAADDDYHSRVSNNSAASNNLINLLEPSSSSPSSSASSAPKTKRRSWISRWVCGLSSAGDDDNFFRVSSSPRTSCDAPAPAVEDETQAHSSSSVLHAMEKMGAFDSADEYANILTMASKVLKLPEVRFHVIRNGRVCVVASSTSSQSDDSMPDGHFHRALGAAVMEQQECGRSLLLGGGRSSLEDGALFVNDLRQHKLLWHKGLGKSSSIRHYYCIPVIVGADALPAKQDADTCIGLLCAFGKDPRVCTLEEQRTLKEFAKGIVRAAVSVCNTSIERAAEKEILQAMLPTSVANELVEQAREQMIDSIATSPRSARSSDESESEDRLSFGRMVEAREHTGAIIFLDICEFSSLSRRVGSSALVENLDKVWCEVDLIALRYDVTKLRTVGDGYLAAVGIQSAFGEDYDQDHVVQRGLAFALEAISTVNAKVEIEPGKNIHISAGIHYGTFHSGVVGHTMPQYDLFGEDVNMAARLEQNASKGELLCTAAVKNQLKKDESDELFNIEERDVVHLKNIGKTQLYRVTFTRFGENFARDVTEMARDKDLDSDDEDERFHSARSFCSLAGSRKSFSRRSLSMRKLPVA